jgi:uncharacterized membrane protein YsdA (DUF1294 family)/cold shock CspA family protein
MIRKGTITFWDDKKGFGFITPDSGKKEIFVHIKEFENQRFRPEVGKSLQYELSTSKDGRLCAKNAHLSEKSLKEISKSTFFALGFITLIGTAVYLNELPPQTIFIYVFFCIITYLIYAKDKRAAEHSNWRTPENTLHILALIGGWPGAMIAQQKLRHKSKKQPFRFIFWVTALANTSALILITTPTGISWVKNTAIDLLRAFHS